METIYEIVFKPKPDYANRSFSLLGNKYEDMECYQYDHHVDGTHSVWMTFNEGVILDEAKLKNMFVEYGSVLSISGPFINEIDDCSSESTPNQ